MPYIDVNLPRTFTIWTQVVGLREPSTAEQVASRSGRLSSHGWRLETQSRGVAELCSPEGLEQPPQPPRPRVAVPSPAGGVASSGLCGRAGPPWACRHVAFPASGEAPVTESQDSLTSAKVPFPKRVTLAGTRVRTGMYQKRALFETRSQTEEGKYWMTCLTCRI